MPLAACADDLDAAELPEQEAQLLARQLLVVDDDGAERLGGVHRQAVILAGTDELRNDDARARAFAGHAVELQLVVGAVDDAQPLVDVAQADAAAGLTRSASIGGDADAVVDDVDDRVAVLRARCGW